MKRKYSSSSYQVPRKRTRPNRQNYRPRTRTQYDSLVVARPVGLSPLATRGWQFPNNGEKKVIDIAVGSIQVNTTASINLLNGTVQGTDYTQRIGRKIVLKSVYIRGYVRLEATAGAAGAGEPQLARMIIVVDNQPNGTVFAITDLLMSANVSSQLNLNNRDRFSILCDKEWVFDPWVGGLAPISGYCGRAIHAVKKYKKINMETIFNAGNAGTIADMNSGALYMVWLGSQPVGVTNDVNAIVSTRVRFVDP